MNDRAVKQLLSALTGRLEEMDAPSLKALTGQIRGVTKADFSRVTDRGRVIEELDIELADQSRFALILEKGVCTLQLAPFGDKEISDPVSRTLYIKR